MDTPMAERLQQMSYSELRKCARMSGIKGNKKAKNLIASILESARSAADSFVALEQEILNSSKKNKMEKFEKDKNTPSDTPRRETYTIDNSLDVSLALTNDLISSSASPALKKTLAEHDDSLNITMTRGSEKKSKKRKVSFVTPLRRSARLSILTPHFTSVKDRPKTPIPSRISSGRKRESPLTKEKKLFSGSLFITNSARKSSEGGRRPSTPMPNRKPKRMKLSSPGLLEMPTITPVSTPEASTVPLSKKEQLNKLTPMPASKAALTPATLSITKVKRSSPRLPASKSALTPATLSITKVKRSSPRHSAVKRGVPLTNPKSKTLFTPKSDNKHAINTPASMSITKVKKSGTPLSGIKTGVALSGKIQTVTPKSQLKKTPLSSAKAKRTTPNFNKLHQKQFDKMESIDEYIKRKQLNSTKKINEQQKFQDSSKASMPKKLAFKKNSSIPKKFNGIPFIPTITSTLGIKTNFGFSTSKPNQTPGKRLPAVKFGLHNESGLSKKLVRGGAKVTKQVPKENTPIQKKFDLKASLSKKLTYKPHTGPLKPLGQTNMNTSIFSGAFPSSKPANENRVIKAKRNETRGVLRGVRKNKRFELQMKNRKVSKA